MTTKQAQTKAAEAKQAEAAAAAAAAEAVERDGGGVGESQPTRRKFNRGSTRRISRAVAAFQAACDEFAKELDLQIYMADADGNRTGPAPMVENIKEMRDAISVEVERAVQPAE